MHLKSGGLGCTDPGTMLPQTEDTVLAFKFVYVSRWQGRFYIGAGRYEDTIL
jgi:hypothetical protein